MQQPSTHDKEQRITPEEILRNKVLLTNPSMEHQHPPTKTTTLHRLARANLFSTHSDIKQYAALSEIPLRHSGSLLRLRSIRQKSKYGQISDNEWTIITINVSGDRFQTHLSTLQAYPNTLLGDENKRKLYWNPVTQEYFFDRHRACFEAILYYYQSNGRLRRPDFVPIDTFLEEIAFFELGEKASSQVHTDENISMIKERPMPRTIWRRYIWFYLEYPQHSAIARGISIMSMLFTICSCVALAVESLPQYTDHWDNICKLEANLSLSFTYVPRCSALFFSPFFIIQTICVAFFTIEFLLRLISTPSYRQFLFSFFNWVDLIAIASYYVFLIIQLVDQRIGLNTTVIIGIRVLRLLRFTRVFKIYLVFQRLKSLRVLSATLRESLVDFAAMITILTLLAFLFGAATYFAEQKTNGDVFDSIPVSIYWGIITITGVGYGDMYPTTAIGRALTCLCALFGSATMGMLASVLVDRYQRVYNRKMYITEPEMTSADLAIISHPEDDAISGFSSRKSSRRRNFSAVLSRPITSIQEKLKSERNPSNKLQLIVSLNDDNNLYPNGTDHIITMIKEKLSEGISATAMNVDLKLIDNDNKELWTISSSDTPATPIIDFNTLSANIDELELINTLSPNVDDTQSIEMKEF